MQELEARRAASSATTLKDLAKYNESDWLAILNLPASAGTVGYPADIPGANDAEKRANYAYVLTATMEAAFPTVAIADRLGRIETSSPLLTFFENNAGFEFGKTRAAEFVLGASFTGIDPADRPLMIQRLKTFERVFKVTPRFAEMNALVSQGVDSAYKAHRMGQSAFVEAFSAAFGGNDAAQQAYGRACWIASAATMLYAQHNPRLNGLTMLVTPNLVDMMTSPPAALADWSALFGSPDFCACEHCRSVYSPAAYLVDLLQLLGRHKSTLSKPGGGFWSAKDLLLLREPSLSNPATPVRRPDIAQLALSCENTNIALPYVDLVNEILEVAVAETTTGSDPIQTTGTQADLMAAPELAYPAAHHAAYSALASAVHPFHLPFHLWNEETRVYLEHLGVRRHELLQTLLEGTPGVPAATLANQIAGERLGATLRDWQILTGDLNDPANATPHAYWGESVGTWVAALKAAPRFLKQAGLTFEELRELLGTVYVNGAEGLGVEGARIKLHPETGCDVDAMQVVRHPTNDIGEAGLRRIHRFLRLRLKTGLRITELDLAVTAFGGEVTAAALRGVATALALREELNLTLPVVLAFWHAVDTRTTEWGRSLYEERFLNKSVTNPVDSAFEEALGPSPSALLSAHEAGVLAGLRIGARDLALLTSPDVAQQELALPSDLPANAVLSLANLSRLVRVVSLAKALRLPLRDFLVLQALSGIQGLSPATGTSADPADTTKFIALARTVQRAPFKLGEIYYLVRHVAAPTSGIAPSEEALAALLIEIDAGVAPIVADTTFAPDPAGEQTRQALLAELADGPGPTPTRAERVDRLMRILAADPTLTSSVIERRQVVSEDLGPLGFAVEAQAELVEDPPADPAYLPTAEERFGYVLVRLLDRARRLRCTSFVTQKLAAAMKLDAAVADHLLSRTLKSFATPPTNALFDFLPPPNGVVAVPTDSDRRKALLRLHKAALIVGRLGFRAADPTQPGAQGELDWLYPATGPTSWLDLNALPLEVPANLPDAQDWFAKLLRLVDLASLRNGLPAGRDALFELFRLAETAAVLTDYLDALSARTGWDRSDLSYLVTPVAFPYPDAFKDEKALLRLRAVFELLARLGVSAEKAHAWTHVEALLPAALPLPPVPDNAADIARDIKQVARAKHDEERWAEIARPLRDVLREKQRTALVGRLVSRDHRSGPEALFEDLLIDVEMSPCQITSRIKQAIGAVQLFIQRSFLGLEEHVRLGEDAAREWKWMKSYRVWEANRKVFLYPENWIESSLRDDKTPLFRALETQLLQGELTNDMAEDAFRQYLAKLDEVARLDVVAMHHQIESEGGDRVVDVLHVVARTTTKPHAYHYRRRVDGGSWTAWEKIDLDIEADHLAIAVYNRRLYLFWPVMQERAAEPTEAELANDTAQKTPQKRQEVQIASSFYKNGRWAPKKITGGWPLILAPAFEPEAIALVARVAVPLFGDAGPSLVVQVVFKHRHYHVHAGYFVFRPCSSEPSLAQQATGPGDFGSEDVEFATRPSGTRMYFNDFRLRPQAQEPKLWLPLEMEDALLQQEILGLVPTPYRVTMPRQKKEPIGEREVLFYKDDRRTFFLCLKTRTYSWISGSWAPLNFTPELGLPGGSAREMTNTWAAAPVTANYIWSESTEKRYEFTLFQHPYVCDFTRRLERFGVPGLLGWTSQSPEPLQLASKEIAPLYAPSAETVVAPFPVEDVDFSHAGAYAQYNWELFFHAPLKIAEQLMKNQRFEEAQAWFHYIFDPTDGSSAPAPQRYWKVKPFYENLDLATIQEQMAAPLPPNPKAKSLKELFVPHEEASDAQDGLAAEIEAWRKSPFNPHLLARLRPIAYQKAVVMKYIENLIAWGDQLFRRDTIESINEATQIYLLASQILGPRPRMVKEPQAQEVKTYTQIEALLDDFSNAHIVELESLVPARYAIGKGCSYEVAPPPVLDTLYFCIPHNDKLLESWDLVADRLFKIRNCMNIEGVVRQLPLFEPPIDPAILVRAVAAGVDIGSVLNDINAAAPCYRFAVLHAKASEFAAAVVGLGAALLGALEKRDGETLSRLRATHEVALLETTREARKQQVTEAKESLRALELSKAVVQERLTFYAAVAFMNDEEKEARDLIDMANLQNTIAEGMSMHASMAFAVPTFKIGTSGIAASAVTTAEFGGANFGQAGEAIAKAMGALGTIFSNDAARQTTLGAYRRRMDDWQLQARLAEKELAQINKQIEASRVRVAIAEVELRSYEKQITRAQEVEVYLRDKFTSEELYDWMITQTAAVYFQSYKLAFDLAKRAEQAFRFERGTEDTSYITFGYWDSLKKGLLAGERLQLDMRRMDAAYLEQNKREYEITKHVSLADHDPRAFLSLREGGTCAVTIPEHAFDLDYPGHYFRRLKTVSLTLPCVTGPFAGVNCRLTLRKSTVRRKSTLMGQVYAREQAGSDSRFQDHYGAIQSIVTSSGQSDSGLFEPNLRDERFLPFEGAGAESQWEIEASPERNQLDDGLSDAILHLRYTAREGGALLKAAAVASFTSPPSPSILEQATIGRKLFRVKADFSDAWIEFQNVVPVPPPAPAASYERRFTLRLLPDMFKKILGSRRLTVTKVELVAKWVDAYANVVSGPRVFITAPAQVGEPVGKTLAVENLGARLKVGVFPEGSPPPDPPPAPPPPPPDPAGPWDILPETSPDAPSWVVAVKSGNNPGLPTEMLENGLLKPDVLEDLWLIVTYERDL